MVRVYSLGKYLYFRGLLLLAFCAVLETAVARIYFGGIHWPSPLPLLAYLSLVLWGKDNYRKLVATLLILSAIPSFSMLTLLFFKPETRNDGLLFYSFFAIDGLLTSYVGYRIVLNGFVRFFLLGRRADDRIRENDSDLEFREELQELLALHGKFTEPSNGPGAPT